MYTEKQGRTSRVGCSRERDIATLERLRREMENAIASGDESLIKIRTFLYNQYADMLKEKYGDI